MAVLVLIFDLDQTLVDSSSIEPLRRAKQWSRVMSKLSSLAEYEGISPLLHALHAKGQTLAILTRSPDMIPKALIKTYGWPIDIVVGYHDVRSQKPDPEGLLLAMSKAGATPHETFHIGDQADDTAASKAANVISVGAGWGCVDIPSLQASRPDYYFSTIADMTKFFT